MLIQLDNALCLKDPNQIFHRDSRWTLNRRKRYRYWLLSNLTFCTRRPSSSSRIYFPLLCLGIIRTWLSLDFLSIFSRLREVSWTDERGIWQDSIVWIEDDIPISVRGLRWEWPVFECTTFGCGDISELAGHGYHSTIALCVLNGVKYLFKS